MRTIKFTNRFKRDYRREKSGKHGKKLDSLFEEIVNLLAEDKPLPPNAVDHSLTGTFNDCRDCHIKPDLILIYRKTDKNELELIRLGSHSVLGL
ncbi:addiction module antitoxin [Chlorobaculum limnaeum]|uniref:Addiction module antitoxin n=1 Tax=Chlorobaculum limnaeum TaxID=274537 RepID=A0A1D8D5M3_CHLLM|nr:type II toxin-antitoxin system YafQ family toxin [Chlorobaculum limnaeum]AOS83834.1 addiction module antitoxin [Chlorobaculum limnaeum]